MIFIGIDAAKDKHDCLISNSDGEVLFDVFTISNTLAPSKTQTIIVDSDGDINKMVGEMN